MLAGILCVVLDAKTVGPEVAGSINTLLVKSEDVTLPTRVSASMGGKEKARCLRDVRLMLMDKKPDEKVEMIVLGTGKGERLS